MKVKVLENRQVLGRTAARHASAVIRDAINKQGYARLVAASAASQIEFLEALVQEPDIEWQAAELFHLDEYIGLPNDHPASFCRFFQERLIDKSGISKTHLLNGADDVHEVIRCAADEIGTSAIDLACIGIGENGHLAFNDPPADFDTELPYIVVSLDLTCRLQQVAEGWFPDLSEVPARAITMSVKQILQCREILAMVPGERKAKAIHDCFAGPISPLHPASILRTHPSTTIYLDEQSAKLLDFATVPFAEI